MQSDRRIQSTELVTEDEIPLGSGFSMASLMLFTTGLSIAFGLITVAPGIGVPLAFVAMFAWINTADICQHWAARGYNASIVEQIKLFARWFCVVVLFFVLVIGAVAASLVGLVFSNELLNSIDSGAITAALCVTAYLLFCGMIIFIVSRFVRYGGHMTSKDIRQAEVLVATAHDLSVHTTKD